MLIFAKSALGYLNRNVSQLELLHESNFLNIYFRVFVLKDLKLTYKNNDFVDCAD